MLQRDRHLEGVARRGLVQGQGRQRIERPRGQVVGVDQIDPRPAAARGVVGRDVGRHRDDAEPCARQVAEVLRRHPVELLGDPGGVFQQLVRGLGVELRVGAQEVQELGERALEPAGLHGLQHLGVDLGHLVQTQLVDPFRRHVGGGELQDLGLVVGLAVGQRIGAQRRLGVGDILVVEEAEQGLVGRDHLAADRLDRLRFQLRLLGGGDVVGELGEGAEEDGVFRRLGLGDGADRGVAALQRHLGRGEAALQPRTHVVFLVVEVARDLAHLRDEVTVLLGGFERPPRRADDVGPEGGVGGQGLLVVLVALAVDVDLDLGLVDLVIDLLGGRQLGFADGVELLHHLGPVGQARLLGGEVDLGQVGGDLALVLVAFAALGLTPGPFGGVDALELGVGGARSNRVLGVGGGCAGQDGRQATYAC